jgi:hypothetical protein
LLFEQLALKVFANFGRIYLSPPIPIKDALAIAMMDDQDEEAVEELSNVSRLCALVEIHPR